MNIGLELPFGAWWGHQWAPNWRQWPSLSLNLSVASMSRLKARALGSPSFIQTGLWVLLVQVQCENSQLCGFKVTMAVSCPFPYLSVSHILSSSSKHSWNLGASLGMSTQPPPTPSCMSLWASVLTLLSTVPHWWLEAALALEVFMLLHHFQIAFSNSVMNVTGILEDYIEATDCLW